MDGSTTARPMGHPNPDPNPNLNHNPNHDPNHNLNPTPKPKPKPNPNLNLNLNPNPNPNPHRCTDGLPRWLAEECRLAGGTPAAAQGPDAPPLLPAVVPPRRLRTGGRGVK